MSRLVPNQPDDKAIAEALARESRKLDFKREFSVSELGTWCELLKDVAAMANSGGGIIVFGLLNDGSPSGWDPTPLLSFDTADITNRFAKYVGEQFDDFEIREGEKGRHTVAILFISPRVDAPLVFDKPGTYGDGRGGQKTAFAKGTIYFRHGAKSEPGTAADIRRFVNREVQRQRRAWLGNVRKVAAAPKGAAILVVPPELTGANVDPGPVRVVDDPYAPAVARTDFDDTHPYRQTEAIQEINDRLGGKVVNPYDIQCVRKVHGVDGEPRLFHKPRFSSPQYSDAFVDWVISEYKKDPGFFDAAKARAKGPV
jgi:hypothetical protein